MKEKGWWWNRVWAWWKSKWPKKNVPPGIKKKIK